MACRGNGLHFAAVNGRRGFDGIDDLLIPGAATQISFDGDGDLVPGRGVVFVEQRLGSDEEAGGTKAALRPSMGGETRLYGGEMCTVREALDGDDVSPLDLSCKGQAGQFWNTVDHYRAATAGSEVTASLHTERSHPVSQDVQKNGVAWGEHLERTSVHRGGPAFSLRRGDHRHMLVANHSPHPTLRARRTLSWLGLGGLLTPLQSG